jgi:cation diffusion facilitator CzcD-associated flavoprotein CzcO
VVMVVVVGAGPIGCLNVRLARARGAARVLLVELSGGAWRWPPGWSGPTRPSRPTPPTRWRRSTG